MSRQTCRTLAVVLCALLAAPWLARAKELDQMTDRLVQHDYYAEGYKRVKGAPSPAQVDALLDKEMNRLLSELQRQLNDERPATPEARDELIAEVFQHPVIPTLMSPYEEWVKREAPVPLYKVRAKGIYGHHVNYDDMRLTWYIELSPIVRVAGVLMGLDKLGHFLGQGFGYYQLFNGQDAKRPMDRRLAGLRIAGHRDEVASLGVATTGIYSFADLAANWQGLLFYLALFQDVTLEQQHQSAFFERDAEGEYRQVRRFRWADWVEDDWDEAINPSVVWEQQLYDKLRDNLRRPPGGPASTRPSVCELYRRDPQAYLGAPRLLRPRSDYWRLADGDRLPNRPLDLATMCR